MYTIQQTLDSRSTLWPEITASHITLVRTSIVPKTVGTELVKGGVNRSMDLHYRQVSPCFGAVWSRGPVRLYDRDLWGLGLFWLTWMLFF